MSSYCQCKTYIQHYIHNIYENHYCVRLLDNMQNSITVVTLATYVALVDLLRTM